jgi:hypothetical protein
MPRLRLFVPCEMVIVGHTGPMSFINILEAVDFRMPLEEYNKLPANAEIPQSWHVVTRWDRLPEESAANWLQRIVITAPNGRVATDQESPIDLCKFSGIRHDLLVNGFPIKPPGSCTISLYVRKAENESAEWAAVANYDILVRHLEPES